MQASGRVVGQLVARGLALFFAIIVVGVISDKVTTSFGPVGVCYYGLTITNVNGSGACQYGEGVGVLAIIVALVLLAFDVLEMMQKLESWRKHIAYVDAATSGLLGFLWFVGFIYLVVQWSQTENVINEGAKLFSNSAAEAVIAFTFFSLVVWVTLTIMAVLKIRSAGSADVST
eukprot:m.137679 g.137679  ORF g.137679 m.137679 type:complete len:174 (+) comp38226_c0_seq3:426-947(+)